MKSHSILNKMKGTLTLLMLLWLTALTAGAQTTSRNVLVVPQFEVGINKVVYVPVHLENTDPVTAVQFNITLPYPVPTDGTPILSLRSDGHSASLISSGNNTYKVVVLSMENKAIRGNKGLLLQIPMQVGNATAASYSITLGGVVLTDNVGNNIATEGTGTGTVVPIQTNVPDLVVPSVTSGTTSAGPGSTLSFSYKVKNQGQAATKDGWTDKFYLESVATGVRLFLGSQRYTSTLGAGSTASRSFQVTLPNALHIDGQARVVVVAEPLSTTGELQSDQWNNEGKSTALVNLSKTLLLTTNRTTVYEGGSDALLTLTRSGDWSVAESFTINCSVSNIFTCNGMTMPCRVTIPARTSGVTLRIAAINDQIVKAREADITVPAEHGYDAASIHLNRVDNDRNPLSLTLSTTSLTEGGSVTLTATRGGELTDVVDMTVGCSHGSRFNGTATLHFAKNQSVATATLQSIGDTTPQLDAQVTFTIGATDYQTATAQLTLADDDRPALTMALSTSCVSENMSGSVPLTATITRDRGQNRAITVWLYSSRSEVSFAQNSVVIPAGSLSVDVPISVQDNSAVDGERTATLTATFYSPSDRNTAPTGDRANTQATLTVVDDESPYLTLSASQYAVAEGSNVTLTVTRTQANISAPVSVTMSCADGRVSFASQPVTIAANKKSATVKMNVASNSVQNDDADVMVWASANGLGSAAMRMRITDNTLPDAVNTSIQTVGEHFFSGLTATVKATIHNYGTATLPRGTTIDFYLCTHSWFSCYARHYDFFQATTDQPIAAGDEKTFEFEAQLPQMVGTYYIYARLNDKHNIQELDYSNNLTKEWRSIYIEAPFRVTSISANPTDCLAGGAVNVQGTVEAVEGSQLNGQTVRVSLKGNGQQTTSDTQIDTQGRFNVTVPIDRSAYGYMTVRAMALGQTAAVQSTTIHVYNMCFNSSDGTWQVDENSTTTGTLRLKNLSAKPITITDFTSSVTLADGANVVFNTSGLNTIAAGATASIPYTVTSTQPSASWQRFTVTAKSAEGLTASLPISYYCQATNSYLVFSPSEVKTTMLWNADRRVDVTVKNIGKKTTENITELITGDWVMSDFGNNRCLAPGEQATVHLTLLAKSYMHADRTYKTQLQLTPKTGRSALLPITVTTTGNEYGRFDLYATDVYSKAYYDYSHLAGASVTVTNARTGATMKTGTLDSQGHWMTTTMQEGVYNVCVTANRHKRVTTQVSVGPGEDRSLTMFLPYKAVQTNFYLTPGVSDHYYLRQELDIDRQAPQGTVIALLDSLGFCCTTETMSIVLQNVGPKPAENIRVKLPVVAGCTFTQLNELPDIMMPGDKHILEVGYTGPNDLAQRYIADMSLHYEFDINGETFSEEDGYKTLVGCVNNGENITPLPPVPPKPEPDEPTPGLYPIPNEPVIPDNDDDGTWIALPTYGCFAKLTFEEASDYHPGDPIQGVLTVKNGLDTPLRSIRFMPLVADEEYADCTSRFSYAEGSTTGFTADGSYRKLAGGSEGTLSLTLTPLAAAAADGEQVYLLGGQLEYIDSSIGSSHAATFIGIYVTVKGSGEVQLTYLIQRNFLSDESSTEEKEDAEPAIFALLAQNIGGTKVSGLKLTTDQPTVVDNATDESVAYASHYAACDGQEGNYTFTDLNLESIESGATADVRWIYSSEQSAHVPDVAAVADDVTSAAGSGAKITVTQPRELLRVVLTPDATISDASDDDSDLEQKVKTLADGNVYLLNDVEDENNLPDAVITSNGEEATLEVVSDASNIERIGYTDDYTLMVNATAAGWVYGRLNDPTGGMMHLESVTRTSDGKTVSLANFWQSDRTPQPDYSVLEENLLHFADQLTGTEESYTLHYVTKPTDRAKLFSIKLLTADNNEVANGATTNSPVKTIEVEFTKGIKRLLFGYFTLTARGEQQDLQPLEEAAEYSFINKDKDKRRWTIDISALPEVPGLHTFSLDLSKLEAWKAPDSISPGTGMVEVTWTENISGQALITINVAPSAKCGTVNPATGELAFGEQELTATPSDGYDFVNWTDENGDVLTTDRTLQLDVWKARTLTANFSPKNYDIEIVCEHYGELKGNTSGSYPYDSELLLAVQPASGKMLKYWKKDGLKFSEEPTVTDSVKGNARYVPTFKTDHSYNATNTFEEAQGWNWISSSLDGGDLLDVKQFLDPIINKVDRVVGFKDELVNDPVFGLVGQLQAINPTEGYKLYLTSAATFTQSDETADPETNPIVLKKGWNWIGYLPVREMTVAEALAELQPMENDVLKTEDAFTTFTNGNWTGTLTTMKPGVGYMYYSGQDTKFHYPVSGMQPAAARAAEHGGNTAINAPWQYDAHKYADNSALIGELYVDGRPAMLGHCVVGAFVDDECRGIGRMIDGRIFLTIHGSLASEQTVTFRAYDHATGEEYAVSETILFDGGNIGTMASPMALHAMSATGISAATAGFTIGPRPMKDKLLISGGTKAIQTVRLLAANGKVVIEAKGNNATAIDVNALLPGIYMVSITTTDGSVYHDKVFKE